MASTILGLDIGGANLKAATADKAGGGTRGEPAGGSPHPRAVSVPFPLWKQPDKLPAALADLVAKFPEAEELAVTMTGELCDCFETKRDGVHAILAAVRFASAGRRIRVWSTDGVFLDSEGAKRNHLKVAAANWHALATFAGHYVPEGRAILVDVGSTTTDIIPILDGVPVPQGKTDFDRLTTGELIYTGVRRTPVCAVIGFGGAAELFATTLDVYLVLGMIPEDPNDCNTADGRPATREHAHARLARMRCADAELISSADIRLLAEDVRGHQLMRMHDIIRAIRDRLGVMRSSLIPLEIIGPRYIVCGSGEFLARRAVHGIEASEGVAREGISLSNRLGAEVSACAPAYAVAVLATECRK